jgi:hypothetical protein
MTPEERAKFIVNETQKFIPVLHPSFWVARITSALENQAQQSRKQVVEECVGVANSMIGEWDGLVPSECFEHWNQACKEIAAKLRERG